MSLCSGSADAAPVLNLANGHYYDLVDSPLNWSDADAAASSQTFLGVVGHLVTITDAQENLFLTTTFGGGNGAGTLHLHWIGGFQPVGSSEPAGGWSWITAEPFVFNNWWPGEPNNSGGAENRIVFDHGVTANGKGWNDLRGTNVVRGYVVEFDVAAVPEPSSTVLMSTGTMAFLGCRLRRRKRSQQCSSGN